MRNNQEYQLYMQVSTYLKFQYPSILYHFDLTGLNLSKAQSGQLKAIQGIRGYPDLQIFEKRKGYGGLLLELKKQGTKLYKKDGSPATPHIGEQQECIVDLRSRGYAAQFVIGFEEAKQIIEDYMNCEL